MHPLVDYLKWQQRSSAAGWISANAHHNGRTGGRLMLAADAVRSGNRARVVRAVHTPASVPPY
jgi:hypothetical protein